MTHRVHCCCGTCKIFDFNSGDLPAFNAGIVYSGAGQFDGTLGPGESITVNNLIDGRGEKGFYRIFADVEQPEVSGGDGLIFTWEGSQSGFNVSVDVTVDGLPAQGDYNVYYIIDFEHVNHSAVECTTTPAGLGVSWQWFYGTLTGSGPRTEQTTEQLIANANNGTWTVALGSNEPSQVTITKVQIVFPDLGGGGVSNNPLQCVLSARNRDDPAIGWTRSHLENRVPLLCDENRPFNDENYEWRQITEDYLVLGQGSGYAELGFNDPGYSEGEADYKHWIGDSAYYKEGETEPMYDAVNSFPWQFTERTEYDFDPILDVITWENEIQARSDAEESLEGIDDQQGYRILIPVLPFNDEMHDLEVKLENVGDGDMEVLFFTGYYTQGADPFDDFTCPSSEDQPAYPPINPNCERHAPACDGFDMIRFNTMRIDKPELGTSIPGVEFAPPRSIGEIPCHPQASSRCDPESIAYGVYSETLIGENEFPQARDLLTSFDEEITDDVTEFESPCAPSGTPPEPTYRSWTRFRYKRYVPDWTEQEIGSFSGSPSQRLDWDFFAPSVLLPDGVTVRFTPTLRMWYAKGTYHQGSAGSSDPGAYVVIQDRGSGPQPPVYTESYCLQRLNNTNVGHLGIPWYEDPGEWVYSRGAWEVFGSSAQLLQYVFSLDPVDVDICDLVPGWSHTFAVTDGAAAILQIAGDWEMDITANPLVATEDEYEQTEDRTDCGEGFISIGPDYNTAGMTEPQPGINGSNVDSTFLPNVNNSPIQKQVDFGGVSITITLE